MPRQIIDTESSRPAYQRRLLLRWIVAIVLLLIIIFAGFELWKGSHHPATNLGLLSSPDQRVAHAFGWGS